MTCEDCPPVDVPPPNNQIVLGNDGWDATHCFLGDLCVLGVDVRRRMRRVGYTWQFRFVGRVEYLGGSSHSREPIHGSVEGPSPMVCVVRYNYTGE